MSMYPESENFEALRRLLAFKRHEQPPPGYFHNFSGRVIDRIRAGERAPELSLFERLFAPAQWLQRLWAALETKPAFAAAMGAAVCSLLLVGVVYSTEEADRSPAQMGVGLLADRSAPQLSEPLVWSDFQRTNDLYSAPSQSSLFPVQQVNFTFSGN